MTPPLGVSRVPLEASPPSEMQPPLEWPLFPLPTEPSLPPELEDPLPSSTPLLEVLLPKVFEV